MKKVYRKLMLYSILHGNVHIDELMRVVRFGRLFSFYFQKVVQKIARGYPRIDIWIGKCSRQVFVQFLEFPRLLIWQKIFTNENCTNHSKVCRNHKNTKSILNLTKGHKNAHFRDKMTQYKNDKINQYKDYEIFKRDRCDD